MARLCIRLWLICSGTSQKHGKHHGAEPGSSSLPQDSSHGVGDAVQPSCGCYGARLIQESTKSPEGPFRAALRNEVQKTMQIKTGLVVPSIRHIRKR